MGPGVLGREGGQGGGGVGHSGDGGNLCFVVFLAEHVVKLRSGEVFGLMHPNCLVFSSARSVSV